MSPAAHWPGSQTNIARHSLISAHRFSSWSSRAHSSLPAAAGAPVTATTTGHGHRPAAQLSSEADHRTPRACTRPWVSCIATWGRGEKPTAAQNRIIKPFPHGADLEPPTSPLPRLSAQKCFFLRIAGSLSPCTATVVALLFVTRLLRKGRTAFLAQGLVVLPLQTASPALTGSRGCRNVLKRLSPAFWLF